MRAPKWPVRFFERYIAHHIKNKQRVKVFAGTSIGIVALLTLGQNCTKSNIGVISTNNSAKKLDVADVTEDKLFLRIQNGLATITEINFSKERYKDYIEGLVSNTSVFNEGQIGDQPIADMTINEAMTTLAQQISAKVEELKDQIFVQRLPTNSNDVLRNYTDLVDLLSRARDLNNFLILKADIGSVRTDFAKLREDVKALQTSLKEVREVIIPQMKQELSAEIKSTRDTLAAEAKATEASLRSALSATEEKLIAQFQAQEKALRADLDAAQEAILYKMASGEKAMMDKLNAADTKFSTLISQQDQSLRRELNDRYVALGGQLTASEKAQREALNQKFADAMEAMKAGDDDLRSQLNKQYASLSADLNMTKKEMMDKLNSQYESLVSAMSKNDRDLRDTLNQKYEALKTQFTEADAAQRDALNSKYKQLVDSMNANDKALRDSLNSKYDSLKGQLTASESAQRDALNAKYEQIMASMNAKDLALRDSLNEKYQSLSNQFTSADAAQRDALNAKYEQVMSSMNSKDRALREKLNQDYQTMSGNFNESVKSLMDKMNANYDSLQASMNKVDRDMRDQLNAKFEQLNGQMSASEKAQRDALNAKYTQIMSSMSDQDKALREELNKDYATLNAAFGESKKAIMDQLNNSYNSLMQKMSQQDRDVRAQLNQKYEQLSGALSDSELRQRESLNNQYNAILDQMSGQDKALREKLNNEYASLTSSLDSTKKDLVNRIITGETAMKAALSESEQRLLSEIKIREASLRQDMASDKQAILDRMAAGDKKQMDALNDKYSSLVNMMSVQDRSLRDQLNLQYGQLGAKMSSSDQIMRDTLNSRFNEALAMMSASERSLRDKLNSDYQTLTNSLDSTKRDLVDQIIAGDNAVRREFDVKMASLKDDLVSRLATTEIMLNNRIKGVEAISQSNLVQIKGLQSASAAIDVRVREVSDQLKTLSNDVSKDIQAIDDQFKSIRTAGNENYAEMVSNWNCSEDMVTKSGADYYGLLSIFKSSSGANSIGEACVRSKEKVLYLICRERYPTFCGQCAGYNEPSACPSWQAMSGRDRLEILLNIRQEVAIQYLNEQSRLQSEALFGGAACKVQCLDKVPESSGVKETLASLNTISTTTAAAACTGDEWKRCGLYGVTYSLAVNDAALNNKIDLVTANLASEIAKVRIDFETEKESVAQRFGLVKDEMDEKINTLKKVTESRFMDVSKAMAGLASGSGEEIAKDLGVKSAELANLAQNLSMQQSRFHGVIAKLMAKDVDVAQATLGSLDEETLKLLSGGMAVSSFDIVTQFFSTLNPDQDNRPFYDLELDAKVSPKCVGSVKYTPFTNIVGRDAHELLAMYYLKAMLLGNRSDVQDNNKIFFGQQGVLKAARLSQLFVGASFDYRLDPSQVVPSSCLSAIDGWAKEIVLNDSRFDKQRTQLVNNLALARMVKLFMDDAILLMGNLGSIEALVASTPGASAASIETGLPLLANQLVAYSAAHRNYSLVSKEVESMIAIQKELSASSNFQNEFEQNLLNYRMKMAEIQTAQQDVNKELNAQIKAIKDKQTMEDAEVSKLKTAMGYVYALAQTDPLASAALKNDVKAAAVVDTRITSLVDAINASGRTETPFDPVIQAIRHVTTGDASCFGQDSTSQLPSGAAFVGSWGLGGWNTCAVNFRSTTKYKDSVLYRLWGKAHKISFRSTISGAPAPTVIDFRNSPSTAPVMKIMAGKVNQGVFDAQVPGLLNPAVSRGYAYNDGIVEMTPIYVSAAGVEKKGTPVVYSMTLYSPLVLDFVNVGVPKLINPAQSHVEFDITASGLKETVGWVSGRQGALLALDVNHNGRIDDGSELFGEFTKMNGEKRNAKNGYEALAQYDDNKDGVIDSKDKIYSSLRLWFDENENGRSEREELVPLSAKKVTALSVKYQELPKDKQNMNDNKALYSAKFFGPEQCGASGCNTYDVYFGAAWRQNKEMITKR